MVVMVLNANDFRQVAVAASRKYYNYLAESQKNHSKNGAGLSLITIHSMSPAQNLPRTYICGISGRIRSADSCFVLFRNVLCDDIEIVKYSNRELKVVLRLPHRILILNPNPAPEDFVIASDLKYLVRRLGQFYRDNQISFSPPNPEPLPPHGLNCSLAPDEFQSAAIAGVFSNPVSYVWGPPGTGKTKCVLAECLLRYICEKKRVLLLAPTNNAVEQMLRGLLPVLRKVGIDLTLVSRIGVSSAAFAKEFPEVVLDSELERELFELQERKKGLLQELNDATTFWNEYRQKLASLASLKNLIPCVSRWYALREEMASITSEISNLDSSVQALSKEQSDLKASIAVLRSHIFNLEKVSVSPPSRFKSIFMTQKQKAKVSNEILKWLETKDRLTSDLEAKKEQYSNVCSKIQALDFPKRQLQSKLESLNEEQSSIFPDAASFGSFSDRLSDFWLSLPSMDPGDAEEAFQKIIDQYAQSIASSVIYRSLEEISSDISDCEKEIEAIGSNDKVTQRRRSLVIASTADSILPYLSSSGDEGFCHVFLDEAGYTSLMRGLVAFSCKCPVTFLGDHYQLAPICEMSRVDLDDMEVSLFALPCAYFSELVSCDMIQLHNLYCETFVAVKGSARPPAFSLMPMFPLMRSYRFSQNLASILSTHIYPFSFAGNPGEVFQVIVLDAPNQYPSGNGRESIPEVERIKHFIAKSRIPPEHYAVFSPYVNQCKLLQAALRPYGSNVMTVHRAQGMEFDFVIFSVTDKHNRFMVDTKLSVGRRTMNTAISRAKKGIILVCDQLYWENQRGQLISDLISISTAPTDSLHLIENKKED